MSSETTTATSPRQPVRRTIMWAPTVVMYLALIAYCLDWLISGDVGRNDADILVWGLAAYCVTISGFALLSMKRPLSRSDRLCGWMDLFGVAFALLIMAGQSTGIS
ncbi:MAG: hypothetical protein KDB82_09840 [Planctomycetes bacterium]|nr:hypothetical protein [Planctomycetota bacterium]